MVDWFFGLLTPAQWDAWRNWLATIGGLAALLIAANTYRRNVRIKREEQARLIYSKFTHLVKQKPGDEYDMFPNGAKVRSTTTGEETIQHTDGPEFPQRARALTDVIWATAIIHNGSKELIGPARIQMYDRRTGKPWDDFSITVPEIEPESDTAVCFAWAEENHPGKLLLATTVIFRDSTAQWWRRHGAEPVERVHDDPENTGDTSVERARRLDHQKKKAVPPDKWVKEPVITLRVRWHRVWRKIRGKSFLP
jgi:hypothetical protein